MGQEIADCGILIAELQSTIRIPQSAIDSPQVPPSFIVTEPTCYDGPALPQLHPET